MYRSTFQLVCCPRCKRSLAGRNCVEGDTREIRAGELDCAQCGATYPIEEGILHLVSKRQVMEAYPEMEEQARKGAPFYDHLLRQALEILGMTPDEARAEYLGRLELIPNARILDVGVGTGAELGYLWPQLSNAQLFGLDMSIEMLHYCRRRMGRLKAHAELFMGFAESLPFHDNTFDAVLHTGSINEFGDQGAAIAEMARVAKPGRRIVITDEWLTPENVQQPLGRRLVEMFPSLPKDVVPPVACVPPIMQDVRLDAIWRGYGYCLQFRKPK